ncbi:tonsoku-like protein [Argiope bruennichi]|uniref:Tonsoku-like protein like n=1 Tax=Argiope bruennichi TaxID=94029 RepID=A0A8T0ES72_ARGBR|nr:tonsoku-like protein [Argiope bruennichi]KAF8777205.1 Tonsoku-like protein like [Argiope bruennichi]
MDENLKKIEKDKFKAINLGKYKEAADLSNYIGCQLFAKEKYEDALPYHLEELELNQKIDDNLGIAIAHRKLGECYAELGNFKKAFSHIKTYLDISVSLTNKVEEQRAWATLGRTFYLKYIKQKDADRDNHINSKVLDQAEKSYFKAFELCEHAKTHLNEKEYAEMKARCLLNLGLVCECRESITECATYIARAVALATKFNLYEDLYRCQSFLGSMYIKHQQYKDALKAIDCAIESAKKLNDNILLVEELMSKAGILISLKDFLGAKSCLVTAYKLHAPVEANYDKLCNLLKICVGLCNSQSKLEDLDPNNNDERKLIFEKMADALSYLENYKLALEYYFETLKCIENTECTISQRAPIYFSIAMTYKDIGEYDKALEYLNKEIDCYVNKLEEQTKSLMNMAEVYEEMGDFKKSETSYVKSVTVAQSSSNNKILKNSLIKLLDFYERNQMTEQAKKIKLKLKCNSFEDLSDNESEEDSPDPFDDICLDELPDLKETESKPYLRRRKCPKKSVFKPNNKGETPLQLACIDKKFSTVKKLIESGHEVNVRDNCGWTPLHEAVNHDAPEIVEYLLDHGADINDRGGPGCQGITPLHDAACCGLIHIMRMLISRGASVTVVDDRGFTPLERLIQRKMEVQDNLTADELKQFEEMEDELKKKMAQAGQPAKDTMLLNENVKDFAFSVDNDFSDDYFANSDSVCHSKKRTRSSSDSSSEENSDDNIEDSSSPNRSIQRDNWDDAKKAKLEYKTVMSSLRLSGKSIIPGHNATPKPDAIPALIEEDKIVDEWLIKDTEHIPKMKKKKRRMSRLQVRTSKSLYNYMASTNVFCENMENVIIDNNTNDSSSNTSEVITESTKNLQESNPSQVIKKDGSKLSFCIKVKITDKLILVPIPEDSCSIGWLAEQAAQRYQDLLGSKPHLTLMTKDGAFLSKTDLVKNLFDNNEEIASNVEFWDEPSLNERYIQLCEKRGLTLSPSIQKRLLNFEVSPELNFSNCSIPNPQMIVIFSVLQYFQNLQHLDLSGTVITDTIASGIISCFPSFSSLVSLNMSCCCLTIETVKNISHYLQEQQSSEARLPHLKTLIMDSNLFYGNSSEYFNIILLLSSLKVLSLYSCSLIPSFFENRELCQLLENSCLEELNVACNSFSEQSINNLLHSLPKKSLKKLDLSRTVQSYSFIPNMCAFLIFIPVLQEVHLEDCNLKDEDLYLLAQSAFHCPQLKSFNISSNADLSSVAILNFLKSILNNNRSLTDIFMTGTCLWDTQSTETLISILSSSNVNNLMLDSIPEPCQEKLIEFWKNHWGGKASCLSALFCKLSIL